jgi:hypothetical protein
MNRETAKRFAALMDMQERGCDVNSDVLALSPTLEDGYCLYNLYGEWKQALGNSPPIREALAPIRRLAHFVEQLEQDDTLLMYGQPEWKQLCALRGPFEGMQTVECARCGHCYPAFCQSGFDDRYPSVCGVCGNVWLQSGYDDSPLPLCECGGQFHSGECPKCACRQGNRTKAASTYQYFASHRLREKT